MSAQTITEPTVRRAGVTWVCTIPDHLIPADDRYYREATDDGPLQACWSYRRYDFGDRPHTACAITTRRDGEFFQLAAFEEDYGSPVPAWVPRPEQDAVEAMLRFLMGGSDE